MPLGICTVESSESRPCRCLEGIGTPSTGSVVCAATTPGEMRRAAGGGDDRLHAVLLARSTPTRPPRAACGAPTSPSPRRARRTPRASSPPPSSFPSRTSTPSTMPITQSVLPVRRCSASRYFSEVLRDDVGGQLRRRRRLVPVERLEVVAHELLVEGRRADADAGTYRPARSARNRRSAPRRSGRSSSVLVQAEFELGVGDDDAARRARSRRLPCRAGC